MSKTETPCADKEINGILYQLTKKQILTSLLYATC